MSKPSKAHTGAAKHHLLRYLARSTDFSITHKQGGFKLSSGPISFKVGIQGLTAQSAMGAKLVAAALTMKEIISYSNRMLELGFKEGFGSVPLYIDNTSALHDAGNRTYSPRAKHIVPRYFFVQELEEKGKIIIHFVKTQDQIADFGTKHANKHRHRALIKLIKEFEAQKTGR